MFIRTEWAWPARERTNCVIVWSHEHWKNCMLAIPDMGQVVRYQESHGTYSAPYNWVSMSAYMTWEAKGIRTTSQQQGSWAISRLYRKLNNSDRPDFVTDCIASIGAFRPTCAQDIPYDMAVIHAPTTPPPFRDLNEHEIIMDVQKTYQKPALSKKSVLRP